MKCFKSNHSKFYLVIIVTGTILLNSCGADQIQCTNTRGFEKGMFQQTWFSKPIRKREYIAAIFDDKIGEIRLSDRTIIGNYCIEDKTIFLEKKGLLGGLLVIEILSIDAETMVLQMSDGSKHKYYNPYPNLNQDIDLEPKKF